MAGDRHLWGLRNVNRRWRKLEPKHDEGSAERHRLVRCLVYGQYLGHELLSQPFGEQVNLREVQVRVTIAAASTSEVKVVEDAANRGGFAIVAPPVDFSVTVIHQDQAVEVASFDA